MKYNTEHLAADSNSKVNANIDDDRNISPMLQRYVQKHESLVNKDNIKQKVSHEDCCAYCDIHADNRLSNGQHQRIEAWTDDVNANMAERQRLSMNKIHSSQNYTKPKIKFLKDIPLGKPDIEKGFRRVRTSSASFRQSKNVDGVCKNQLIRRRSFHEKALTDRHLNKEKRAAGQAGEGLTEEVTEQTFGAKPQSARSARSCAAPSEQRSVALSYALNNTSSTMNNQLGSRTTSNNLLNCGTIDDVFLQHRSTLANKSVWCGLKCVQEQQPQPQQPTTADPSQNTTPAADLAAARDNCARPNSTSTASLKQQQQLKDRQRYQATTLKQAVSLGFDMLEATNETTNTVAHKGLYKYEKSCGQPLEDPKGSKRFQKLNKNLHKMVEDFHLNGSSLSNKMKYWKEGGPDINGQVSTLGDSSNSISSFASSSNNLNRTVRFKNKSASTRSSKTKARSAGGRGNVASMAGLRVQNARAISDHESGDDGRESFLEMIMDMDEKKSGRQGNVQIQPFLYV